ncbi:MAG: hypothetical protein IPL92_08375 [Saprospiraceae bacterium]|nr:hypothetical protein [Candidatus Opimibacter iunctus]
MKNWLFSINILLFFSTFMTCNTMQKNNAADMEAKKSTAIQDSITTRMDSIIADSILHATDTLTKDEKYNQHQGEVHEAPKHDSPEQMKIDSIKAAKAKKKKG